MTDETRQSPAETVSLDQTRVALFMCAASCQGGHSDAGMAAAEALGIPFPVRMDALVEKAIAEGRDTDALWPWLMRRRKPHRPEPRR